MTATMTNYASGWKGTVEAVGNQYIGHVTTPQGTTYCTASQATYDDAEMAGWALFDELVHMDDPEDAY